MQLSKTVSFGCLEARGVSLNREFRAPDDLVQGHEMKAFDEIAGLIGNIE